MMNFNRLFIPRFGLRLKFQDLCDFVLCFRSCMFGLARKGVYDLLTFIRELLELGSF